MGMLNQIDHIVVLMLENRSFDNLFGRLYPKSAEFDGLSLDEANLDAGNGSIKVWNQPGIERDTMSLPSPDPGELWFDINTQIFGVPNPSNPLPSILMGGFARNYANQTQPPSKSCLAKNIMHYFTPEQVPVISRLARQFAVSDRWHASAPCQTWPNRFFVHTSTANGYENNSPTHFPYEMPTIFNRFDDVGITNGWKIYFHDAPQSLTLAKLWPRADRFRLFQEFLYDAENGQLPSYSFIEPRYFTDVELPNDMHPPHVVTLGEQLIARVYNALRNGPNWTKTLFIITFDEHGGCYDHVPPPLAVPPSSTLFTPFGFNRYGVRVPAVLISPYIPQGTIARPPGAVPFDHTSVIATLRARFALGPPLSDRDAQAPGLDQVLSLPEPTNLGPEEVDPLPYVPSPSDIAIAQAMPLNDMQRALARLAAHLPQQEAVGDFAEYMRAHVDDLKVGAAQVGEEVALTSVDAAAEIKKKLGVMFRSLA